VLVTSRTQLTGLAVAERIHLGALPSKQAVELLAKIAGADRVAREPDAAAAIAALCGHLPLALRMAGGMLAANPPGGCSAWPIGSVGAIGCWAR
jgi:hypothetical protein